MFLSIYSHTMLGIHSATFAPANHKYNPEFALPGSKPHYTPNKVGNLEHIFLDIAVDVEKQTCEGWSTSTITPYSIDLETVKLDAVNMEITTVKINDVVAEFDYDGKEIVIHLPNKLENKEKLEIAVQYKIEKPSEGMTFIAPSKAYPQKPLEVWTQGESEGSRHWFPCFDFPAKTSITEVRVRADAHFTVVSNGELIEEREYEAAGKNLKVWHFSQKKPHPNYLIFLGIGEYAVVNDSYTSVSGDIIPLRYIGPKGSEELLKLNGGRTPEMMAFLEEKYGVPYPWAKYDQIWATDFIWGGMENTTTTVIAGDRGLGDARSKLDVDFPEIVVEHELAHQWFGDLIVVKHWSNLWIKEGAATYSEVMWKEFAYGRETADYYRLNEIRNYIANTSEYKRPVSTNFYKYTTDLYDRFSYEKAGLVYHSIRSELGDEFFWKSLQRLLTDNAHQPVEPVDLLRAIEKTTGKNIQPLLDQYIFGNGHPDFVVSYSWDSEHNLAKLTVTQKQAKKDDPESIFDLKIPVTFGFVDSKKDDQNDTNSEISTDTVTIRVHEIEQSFYFPMSTKPSFVSFDSGNNTLKTVELQYPLPELKEQLRYGQDVMARTFAAQAIAKKGGLEGLKILQQAYKNEQFWGVRVEIIRRISEIKLDQTFAALLPGLTDTASQVRRITIASLAQFKTLASWLQVKKGIDQGDESYLVEMQSLSTFGAIAGSELMSDDIRKETVEILQEKLEHSTSWIDLLKQGAVNGLSYIHSVPEIISTLIEYTKAGNSTDIRRSAISALGSLSIYQNDATLITIIDAFKELLSDQNIVLQMSLVGTLEQMRTPLAIELLASIKNQAIDTRVIRDAEVAISTVQKNLPAEKSFAQIRTELEEIKKQNQELKSQIEEVFEQQKAAKKKTESTKKDDVLDAKPAQKKTPASKK